MVLITILCVNIYFSTKVEKIKVCCGKILLKFDEVSTMAKGRIPELEAVEKILDVTPEEMAASIGQKNANLYKSYRRLDKKAHFEAIAIFTAFKKSGASLEQMALQIKTLEILNKAK